MLKRIHKELVLIRKELQAIRSSKESTGIKAPITIDGQSFAEATRGRAEEVLHSLRNSEKK